MSYSLEFKESALKEWKKLDGAIREQFKKWIPTETAVKVG